MKLYVVIGVFVANTCAHMVQINTTASVGVEIEKCIQLARQELPSDMEWEGELACFSAAYTNLPRNNMTAEDWSIFEEAARDGFGLKPPKSGFRTRREVRTLSDDEWDAVAKVWVTMYQNGTLRKFGRLHGNVVTHAHRGAAFLAWHRVFITHFEEEMRKINPNVSLPYWDYTLDNNITKPTDSVVWTECFFGENDGIIKSGPFKHFRGAYGAYLSRDADDDCFARLVNKIDIKRVLQYCEYKDITTGTKKIKSNHNLEALHDGVHDWVGGDMGVIATAGFDPVFYMHHAFIDYIFEQFRKKQQTKCLVDIETNYRPLDDLCRPCIDGTTHGQAPYDTLWGYSHLRNIDGLWLNWTTKFYNYEPAPSCPNSCKGKYLYCDKLADPNYPNGLCLTRTTDACNRFPKTNGQVTMLSAPLEPTVSCSSDAMRFQGLPGDGRTRDMTEEEARPLLNLQIERLKWQVPTTWPSGTYGLMQTAGGCPGNSTTWAEGLRKQQYREDSNIYVVYSNGIENFLKGDFNGNSITTNFCIKNTTRIHQYEDDWPAGSYCLLKKGDCPLGFSAGFIYWDDGNVPHGNDARGELPDGQYDSNTRIYYCCRDDGATSTQIYLPIEKPFILLRYGTQCQSVYGMTSHEVFIRWHDEYTQGDSSSGGKHPYDDGGNGYHLLHFCYYQQTFNAPMIG